MYILTLIVTLTEGFYLPGLAPVVYCDKSATNINKKCQVKMIPEDVIGKGDALFNFRFDCCFRLSSSRDVHSSQIPLYLSQFISYSV